MDAIPHEQADLVEQIRRAIGPLLPQLSDGDQIEVQTDRGKLLICFHDQTLTQCEQDIINVLRSAGRKMTRKEIIAHFATTLKSCWQDDGWSVSTVEHALASLVRRGRLLQRRDRRGYALAEWEERRRLAG